MFVFEVMPSYDLGLLGILNARNLADLMTMLEPLTLMYLVGKLDDEEFHELLAYARAAMESFEVKEND